MIIACRRPHPFQDCVYGPGLRVHNECGPKRKGMYRCTICGTERLPSTPKASTEEPKPKNKKQKKTTPA